MLLISDANILIDFEDGGLIEALFRLSAVLAVPDVLFEDELRQHHAHLLDLGLEVRELRPEAVQRALDLSQTYRRPSRYDLLALALAEQEVCPLVTGDWDLRKVATVEGVEVHGTLWLMERLVLDGVLTVDQAGGAYERMREAGSRLPWKEVNAQLARLAQDGGSSR